MTRDEKRLRRASLIHRHAGVALAAPALTALAVFVYYPVVASVWLSLHRVVLSLPQIGEPFVGFENYRDLLASGVFWRALGTTLLFAGSSTLFELLLGLVLALCMHASYRGRGWVRAALLIPWAVPTVVTAQMWRFLLNDRYGPVAYSLFAGGAPLADPATAFATLVLADVWKTTPFAALILLAGLQAIPERLYEAAEIDGATPLRRFLHVTLPLLRPALLAALLFRTIDALRVFDLVFVLTQGGPADATNVLQYLGYKRTFASGLLGSGASVSTVIFLITFTISIFYVRLVGSRLWQDA